MDAEDEMVDLCLISQASHIESLVQQISYLNQQINDLQQGEGIHDVNADDTLVDQNQQKLLTDKDAQIESLYIENENLHKELEKVKNQYTILENRMKEETESNSKMEEQSVRQIHKLGMENEDLKEENCKLKREIELLQVSNKDKEEIQKYEKEIQKYKGEIQTYEKDIQTYKEEVNKITSLYHSTLQELDNLKSHSSNPLESVTPLKDTSPTKLLTGKVDVNQLSLSDLQHLYQSEHNQIELYTSYFHELNDIIDETLAKFVSPDLHMEEDIATHDKLKYFIEVMTIERKANAGNVELLRECEEWKAKSIDLQSRISDMQHDNDYLQSCIQCCEHYLDRLVGGDTGDAMNRLLSIDSRFATACRRSQKLMNEYQNMKQTVLSLNEEILRLKQQFPVPMGDYSVIPRLMNTAHSLAEHMYLIPKNCNPSWSDLELALQRIDGIVVEQMPLLARKLKEFKETIDTERFLRKQVEERLRLYE